MTIMDNHHCAMEAADKADRARRLGRHEEALQYFSEAFYHERLAAMKLQDHQAIEPTRSILFRSAASLAIECEEFREAERLIAFALTGSPPDEIAEELRDLLETVTFERHLRLRGIKLNPNELQLSLSGPTVGLGFAQSRELRERVEKIETLSFRTLERKLNRPFRETGRPAKDVTEKFDIYISVPRAASFALTIRLAGGYLPGLGLSDPSVDVMSEIVECVDLLNKREDELLKERIRDKAYYENFVSITRQMAPDGKRVSHVGLTLQKDGEERRVPLERIRSDWDISVGGTQKEAHDERVEIQGVLRFADATMTRHGRIDLIDAHNVKHKVNVPLGMMADIVRPLFEYEVIVTGRRDTRGCVLLEDITRVADD